ncbi:MAG: DNA polymerase III subunit beta [Enterobacteriaceae bacterium]|nr:DNA polymerase III subunit beta [Enterobacteriaceae bacterium]
MYFETDSENLLKILKIVSVGVYKNYSRNEEIFSNILIKILDKQIFCISINTETEIITHDNLINNKTSLVNSINGEVIVPFKKFFEICKTGSKNSTINVTKKNKTLEISMDNSIFSLTCAINSFPELYNPRETTSKIKISYSKFKSLFNKILFSVAENESRQFLNGIFIEKKNTHLYAISSDGYRLSYNYIVLDEKDTNFKLIVPKKTITDINNIFSDEETIYISHTSNNIKFQSNKTILISKLIDDEYPNCYELINKNTDKTIILDKIEIKKAIIKTTILYSEKNKKTKILIKKNNMKIITSNADEYVMTNLNINYNQEDTEILLNTTYLMDVINAIESKTIKFMFSNKNDSIKIQEENSTNIYIIMPFKS